MRNPFSLMVPLLFALIPLGATLAQESTNRQSHVRFAWSAPGVPATITLPLPADLDVATVESVTVTDEVDLAGFSIDGEYDTIELYVALPAGGPATFDSIDLRLQGGTGHRYDFGIATLVSAQAAAGPLRFLRSLAIPAGGLYGAVALRNDGDESLRLTGVEYLGGEQGSLLVARGFDEILLLERLERVMTPAEERRGRTGEGTATPPEGYEMLRPDASIGTLAPREVVVLAWSHESLVERNAASYLLQPVIVYEAPVGRSEHRLGLPVAMRIE